MRIFLRVARVIGVLMIIGGSIMKFIQVNETINGGITDDSLSNILLYGGIAITVISSILGVFASLSGLRGEKMKNGELGLGITREIRQTGTYINNNPQVAIKLAVIKQDGTEFETTIKPIIPLTDMGSLSINSPLPIKIDDRDRVALTSEVIDPEKLQSLYEEWGIKHGLFTAESVEIKKNGSESYATVNNLVPLGSMQQDRIPVEIELTLTTTAGREETVTVRKEVPQEAWSYVQPGNVINVMYLPSNPAKLIIVFPNSPEAIRKSFENAYAK